MYAILTKNTDNRWSYFSALEVEHVAQKLWDHIRDQPSEARRALLAPLAKDYALWHEDAEADLMLRMPVDVLSDVLEDRLRLLKQDEEDSSGPLLQLYKQKNFMEAGYIIVYQEDHCARECLTVETIGEDGKLEPRCFTVPCRSLLTCDIIDGLRTHDLVYGTGLYNKVLSGIKLSQGYTADRLDPAGILNLELDSRL